MSVEIEVKARTDDPEAIRSALSRFAEFQGEFIKNDVYWFCPPSSSPPKADGIPVSGVRVRQEKFTDNRGTVREAVIVTYKTKEVRDGIEINQEREFHISDKEVFEELLNHMGLIQGYSKKKSGFAWNYQGITAELVQVEKLGWFAELEILADDDTETTVKSARKRLLDLLGRINISEDKIEPRYYSEMLKNVTRRPPAGP
jgi:adenylate cyclase class 2